MTQNIEEIRQKYFLDCKKIISELLYVEDADRLIGEKPKVEELAEKISFLKILNENSELFISDINENEEVSNIENSGESLSLITDIPLIDEEPQVLEEDLDEIISEQILFSEEEFLEENSEKFLGEEESQSDEYADVLEEILEENNSEEETLEENVLEEQPIVVDLQIDDEETITETELTAEIGEESDFLPNQVENLIDFENNEQVEKEAEEILLIEEEVVYEEVTVSETHTSEHPNNEEESIEEEAEARERKIKLAHIKGLKNIHSLFDDEFLEEEKQDDKSLVKSNIPIDYMEAERPKQEFKLDLNDKIAFSKILFEGSQSELNETVAILNQFKTLDEAKEFLSEMYYAKKWDKVDEYAQRLWALVEDKFL
ncbi:MAG: hypothetical protein Q4G16_01540 [Cruoricaptor ignavus]|nr:hypothetical protein [Cruoricaptor ignavus]